MIEEDMQDFLDGFFVEPVDPITDCIITPFLDRDGYPIRIFIRKRGGQYYLFHEKGRIITEKKTGRGQSEDLKERWRSVLRRFDVYHINGEITAEATAESLPLRFRNMVQALILLDAMY